MDLACDLGTNIVTMHIGHLPEDAAHVIYQEALRTTIKLAKYAEQPEPVPSVELLFHTDSVHPRALLAPVSEVPPTEVTFALVAGYCSTFPPACGD